MCAEATPRSLCACRSAMAGFALSRPETSYLLFHFPVHRWQTKRPGGRAITETLASIDRLHFGVFGFQRFTGRQLAHLQARLPRAILWHSRAMARDITPPSP